MTTQIIPSQKQLKRIFDVMEDGQWRTPAAIATITGDRIKSVTSRLRDLRLPKFGGYNVEARLLDPSTQTWEYKLHLSSQAAASQTAAPHRVPASPVPPSGWALPNAWASSPIPNLSKLPDFNSTQDDVKFLNMNTFMVEYVSKNECQVKTFGSGKYKRVVALDQDGDVIPHLITTQSDL
jgi:hypothetical protein